MASQFRWLHDDAINGKTELADSSSWNSYDDRSGPPSWFWPPILVLWFVLLCLVPDPRPLGAPDWAVNWIRSLIEISEPAARAVATIVLRAVGVMLTSILLSLWLSRVRLAIAAPMVLLGTIVLTIASMWINLNYFPITVQIQLAILSAIVGSLIGMILRRSLLAIAVLIVFLTALFVWGTSTGISDDLDRSARAVGLHVLEHADEIPDGDEGFIELVRIAFQFSAENSTGNGSVESNKAAILALGVILGEEHIASVAGREIDGGRRAEIDKLDQRISIRGRTDLTRHFWVSAALAVLTDQSRSMDVGIVKELMDTTEGGSGFSFVDLTADRAGTLFAGVATKNSRSADNFLAEIKRGIEVADFFPEIDGLPQGLNRDDFRKQYGGLGGTETTKIVEEIRSRLAQCSLLEYGK